MNNIILEHNQIQVLLQQLPAVKQKSAISKNLFYDIKSSLLNGEASFIIVVVVLVAAFKQQQERKTFIRSGE